MAKCSKCGTNVGCGCQLKNGLCAYCSSAKPATTTTSETQVKQQTNVATPTGKLS